MAAVESDGLGDAAAVADANLADQSAASTCGESWAVPDTSTADSLSQQQVATAIASICKTHGGPYQYLDAKLNLSATNDDKVDIRTRSLDKYAAFLWATFPERDDTYYQHDSLMPAVKEDDFASTPPTCVHITSLGFMLQCSVKPPPGTLVCEDLTGQYMTDGFQTSAEPLRVVQPESIAHLGLQCLWSASDDAAHLGLPLSTFSLGYVKGFARITTLHAILYWLWENGIDIEACLPKLHSSILQIWVYHNPRESKMHEALKNMKVSCAGSIRRAPNVIAITQMIRNVCLTSTCDWQNFVRQWNTQSAAGFKIAGARASSLRLHFEHVSTELSGVMLDHVQDLGYGNCVWSDDNMSTKKLYPPYQFQARGKLRLALGKYN